MPAAAVQDSSPGRPSSRDLLATSEDASPARGQSVFARLTTAQRKAVKVRVVRIAAADAEPVTIIVSPTDSLTDVLDICTSKLQMRHAARRAFREENGQFAEIHDAGELREGDRILVGLRTEMPSLRSFSSSHPSADSAVVKRLLAHEVCRRVYIHKNGEEVEKQGQLLVVTSTMTLYQLLDEATTRLKLQHAARRFYTREGIAIETLDEIADRMDLYAAVLADPFRKPARPSPAANRRPGSTMSSRQGSSNALGSPKGGSFRAGADPERPSSASNLIGTTRAIAPEPPSPRTRPAPAPAVAIPAPQPPAPAPSPPPAPAQAPIPPPAPHVAPPVPAPTATSPTGDPRLDLAQWADQLHGRIRAAQPPYSPSSPERGSLVRERVSRQTMTGQSLTGLPPRGSPAPLPSSPTGGKGKQAGPEAGSGSAWSWFTSCGAGAMLSCFDSSVPPEPLESPRSRPRT
eukprot:tig00021105_g18239.t1